MANPPPPSGIGLVIHGKAEVYKQEMRPFGCHKQYGYWRSSYHKTLRKDNLDLLHLKLEDSAAEAGAKVMTTSGISQCNSKALPNTIELTLEESGSAGGETCNCLQEADGNPILTYDEDASTASNSSWLNNAAYDPAGCSSFGDKVAARFYSDGTTLKLEMSGCTSETAYTVTSVNSSCTEFTFENVDLDGCCGGIGTTHNRFKIIATSATDVGIEGIKDANTGVSYSVIGSGVSTDSFVRADGTSRPTAVKGIQAAGTIKDDFGDEAEQERNMYLTGDAFVIIDSGSKCVIENSFTVYTSFIPDGKNDGAVIVANYKQNPATFVLGTNDLGHIYARADIFDASTKTNTILNATTQRPFSDYTYPIHAMVVKCTGIGLGESAMRVYINGELEAQSLDFTRIIPEERRADKWYLGRSERQIGRGDFNGWINEFGVGCGCASSGDIRKFFSDARCLPNFMNESLTSAPSGGAYTQGFTDAFNTKDEDYVQFIVESGGGAFDTGLWGLGDYAVSSCALFPLSNVNNNFWQVSPEPSGISVEMWVKHDTNHSGCYLTASLSPDANKKGIANLSWKSDAYVLGSGVPAKRIGADGLRFPIPEDGAQATVTLFFGDTEFDDVNKGTITLTDYLGVSKTFTIINDYTGVSANSEFEAGAANTVAAANLTAAINDATYGFNGSIVATDNGYGSVTLTQAAIGTLGNSDIVYAHGFENVLETVAGTSATAAIRFGDTEFDDVNDGTIAMTDYSNVTKTLTIVNDYSGVQDDGDFEAGASNTTTQANFIDAVNHPTAGFNGRMSAKPGPRGGEVTLTQGVGLGGNTSITYAASFTNALEADYSTAFTGGSGGGAIPKAFTGGKVSSYVGGAGLQKITLQGKFGGNWGWWDYSKKEELSTSEENLSARESLKTDIDNHLLGICLYYPSATGDGAFDSSFKVYSAKVVATSLQTPFDWKNSRPLYTKGDAFTSVSGTRSMDLYLEASRAVKKMDLFIGPPVGRDTSVMSSESLFFGMGTIAQNSGMSLYIPGGVETSKMNMFLKTKTWSSINNSNDLFLYAAGCPFLSGIYTTSPLYLQQSDLLSGPANASMNMSIPNVGPGRPNDRRLLFVKGAMPEQLGSMDLFMLVASGVNRDMELYLKTVDSIKASGSMNMMMQAPGKVLVGRSSLTGTPTIVYNSGISMYTYGKETISPINSKATATLQFSSTDFNSHNKATISLTDVYGVNKTYTIRNDYGADTSNNEFEAGAFSTVAADNFVVAINSSTGHNGSITAVDSGNGLVVLRQATTGFGGHTEIARSVAFDKVTSINAPTTFVGGISTGIKQNATAKFTFHPSDFNSVNGASVTLTDASGTSLTYTIRNDYGATGATEFNAGGSRGAAAENFAQVVDDASRGTATVTITDYTKLNTGDKVNLIATDGTNYDFDNGDQSSVNGTWESTTSNNQTATNLATVINTSSGPSGTRFSASAVGAVVTITQNTGGSDGNTAITLTDTFYTGMTKTDFTGGSNDGGHEGTIHALDSAGVRFTSGGYDFSDGVVVFKQERQGNIGETEITSTSNFNDVLSGSVPGRFTDGLNSGMSLVMPNVIGRPNNNIKLRIKGTE
jgi:hypothetical protein